MNSSTGLRDAKNSFQFSAEVQKGNSGGPLIGPGGTIVGVVQSKLDALKLSKTTDDLTQNVNFATKSAVLLKFIEGVPNLPTTRPLQPEQPLKAIRFIRRSHLQYARNRHHQLIHFSLSASALSRSSVSTSLRTFTT